MIDYTPLFPSNLRILTGPSSPASPLSPPPLTAPSPILSPISTATNDYPSLPSPTPPLPLPWIWYCDMCHKHYPLGATRRCLHDSQRICYSPTEEVSKHTKKIKQREACTTKFDYRGWSVWNEWRRRNFPSRQRKHKQRTRDCCHKCDYPSQCVTLDHSTPGTPVIEPLFNHSPQATAPPAPRVVSHPASRPASRGPCTTFEQLLGPPGPETPSTSTGAVSKRAGTTRNRLVKVAETHSAQQIALLSPIQEEFHASQAKPKTPTKTHETASFTPNTVVSSPCKSPTRTSSGLKKTQRNAAATIEVPSPAAAEDFQSFKARMDRIHGSSGDENLPCPAADSPNPGAGRMRPAPLQVVVPPRQRTSPPSATEDLALASMESTIQIGPDQRSLGRKTGQQANKKEGEIDVAGSTTSKPARVRSGRR